tara:strand:- start:26 stop:565 length:540 start_codon:yes stop_codon:yes gene_type:complete
MDVNRILELDPNKEHEIIYDGYYEWKHCYFQIKNKSNADIDPNKLPLLDDEYLGDTGEPLENDDYQEVYDPTQEIHYDLYKTIGFKLIFKSKSFVKLLQKKINQFIDSGEIDLDDEDFDFDYVDELFDCSSGYSYLDSLFYSIDCNDYKEIEDSEDNDLLWFTSSQLDTEGGDMIIKEI